MHDMPKSAERWYWLWINQFPESWHPNDLERFYMFISVLIHSSRKPRGVDWLEDNIRVDRPQLSEDDIRNYCKLFEYLRDYSNVWKSQQANLIAEGDAHQEIKKLREKRLGKNKQPKINSS
jgi:hypothetical protein